MASKLSLFIKRYIFQVEWLIATLIFDLVLLNIALCQLQIATVVYTSPEFDVQVLCMQGIHTTEGERATRFDSSAKP